MNYFQRRKILKQINAMDLIPVRYRGHEMNENRVVVLVPKFENKIYRLLMPRTQKLFFRIKLDELGSLTWEMIDGKRSVQEIAGTIRKDERFKETDLDELEDRLSKYMTMLYERRFISFRQLMIEN